MDLPSSHAHLKMKEGFALSYDRRLRNPNWVYEIVTKDQLDTKRVSRQTQTFRADPTTPEPFRVHPTEFAQSGYDRGHLVPARDVMYSPAAMEDSFLMTNVSPQVGPGFNRDYWARFEGFVRHLAKVYDEVHVITGPLFLPQNKNKKKRIVQYEVIGPHSVAVPTHFFKVIFAPKQQQIVGFVLPNAAIEASTRLTEFIAPIPQIESASGLELFRHTSQHRSNMCDAIACALPKQEFKRVIKQ